MAEMLVETPETRFVGLMSELFQLCEAEELDFGIYRIIRRHNQQVRAFLGEVATEQGEPVLRGGELAGILEQAFARIEDAARQEKKVELQQMADELGISAHGSAEDREHYLAGLEKVPAMRQRVLEYRHLREELETTYSATADRGEVLNRLYEFYARHYQDGDFIVQRRYGRNGARYIRSSGSGTFGLTLKRIVSAGVETGPIDLVESLIYLLGLHVERLYREQGSVIITGLLNHRSQPAAVFWRDNVLHEADWLQAKMAEHPADRYYTNDLARLSFPGVQRFTALETVFVEGMS